MRFKRLGFDYYADKTTKYYFQAEDGRVYMVTEDREGNRKLKYLRTDILLEDAELELPTFESKLLTYYVEQGMTQEIDITKELLENID